MRPLLTALTLAALAAGTASAAPKQRPMRYQLTFSGGLSVVHTDRGLQSNGGGCGLGPDDTSPFADIYTISLRWNTTFNVTLKAKRVQVTARATSVTGGRYTYQGYAYGFNCQEILYGPGGQPCTGALADGGSGSLTAQGSPARKPRRVTFASQPFGLLVATPPDCTVGSNPPVTYTAADELGLDELGQTIARTFNVPARGHPKAHAFKLKLVTDCSLSAQSPGETDACTTTYTGRGSLRVRPL
jgi:hypothetical protein